LLKIGKQSSKEQTTAKGGVGIPGGGKKVTEKKRWGGGRPTVQGMCRMIIIIPGGLGSSLQRNTHGRKKMNPLRGKRRKKREWGSQACSRRRSTNKFGMGSFSIGNPAGESNGSGGHCPDWGKGSGGRTGGKPKPTEGIPFINWGNKTEEKGVGLGGGTGDFSQSFLGCGGHKWITSSRGEKGTAIHGGGGWFR